jgi:tRNA(Ile)-lysidine synthase
MKNVGTITIAVDPGTYVVAVSGGVDSMVLLDLLSQLPLLHLVVAHYDHGIRQDSKLDRQLVQHEAMRRNLQFVYDEGHLGIGASEAKARTARYNFLHRIREASRAAAIITAHHQDDLLETALLNMIRGTGRRGLTSLRSQDTILRPLLHIDKQKIRAYAEVNGLRWHEDESNTDIRYKRNYIRHVLVPRLNPADRKKLLGLVVKMHETNDEIELHLINHLHLHSGLSKLDRHSFIMLPHAVSREVMVAWLRKHDVKEFDKKTIERLIVAAKTYSPGGITDIDKSHKLKVSKTDICIETARR